MPIHVGIKRGTARISPERCRQSTAVPLLLRSWVAPLRCPLSYTTAKIEKVLETTKTFPRKFAKKGKVSHVVGQKKGISATDIPKLL